jgi:hypothetical protein
VGYRATLLALYAAAVLLRMPDVVVKGRLWAEEGAVYLYNALHEPWYDALFAVHTGYLNLAASSATLLAVDLLPLGVAPLVTTGFAFLVQLCASVLLLTSRVEWLRNRWTLALAMLLLLACDTTGEVWLNSITSQFHLALCAALILALPLASGWRMWFRLGLLALGPLSGPASTFVAPLFLLRAWLDRSLARLIQAGVIAGCGGVQVLVYLLNPEPARGVGIGPRLLGLVVYVKHVAAPLLGVDHAQDIAGTLYERVTAGRPIWLEVALGYGAMLALAAVAWSRRDATVRWLFAAAIAIMTLSYAGGLGPHIYLLAMRHGGRYDYVPSVLLGLTLLGVSRTSVGWLKAGAIVLVVWIVAVGMHGYLRVDPVFATGPAWSGEVAKWQADPHYCVQLWPNLLDWKWPLWQFPPDPRHVAGC